MISDAVLLAAIAALQAVGTGITTAIVKANSCGGSKCKKVLSAAGLTPRDPFDNTPLRLDAPESKSTGLKV